jgi:hypothetical protein
MRALCEPGVAMHSCTDSVLRGSDPRRCQRYRAGCKRAAAGTMAWLGQQAVLLVTYELIHHRRIVV